MMVSSLITVPEFIIKTYGIRISCALFIICFPIMMTASCCVNSMRQPPLLHWNIVSTYAYISFKYPMVIFITVKHFILSFLLNFYITHATEYITILMLYTFLLTIKFHNDKLHYVDAYTSSKKFYLFISQSK